MRLRVDAVSSSSHLPGTESPGVGVVYLRNVENNSLMEDHDLLRELDRVAIPEETVSNRLPKPVWGL